jgi:NADH dehydrogenase
VGGGFGGLYTALYLHNKCQGRHPCRITLLDPSDRFTFTPLLYEVLTDELKPWEIAPAYRDLLHHTAIEHRAIAAQSWDLKGRTVTLANGDTLPYDYLVIATGSQQRPMPVPGVQAHALSFRSYADAVRLEHHLGQLPPQERHRITVVGGGPSGVEVACKLADRLGSQAQVQLVERGDGLLKPFPARMQRVATRAVLKRHITLRLKTGVKAITADTITLEGAEAPGTQPTDLVIWAAGTRPTPWLGAPTQVDTTPSGQCQIRPTLQHPQHPEVFVVGDQAAMPWQGDRPAPQTAQAAYQAASTVAHNLFALMRGRSSLRSFRYLHLGDMMTLGQGDALVSSFGLILHGAFAALIRQVVYLERLPTWGHRLRVARHRLRQVLRGLGLGR